MGNDKFPEEKYRPLDSELVKGSMWQESTAEALVCLTKTVEERMCGILKSHYRCRDGTDICNKINYRCISE